MKLEKFESKNTKEFEFPMGMYFIAKFLKKFPKLADVLHTIEVYRLRKHLKTINDVKPIFITGLARSGTTITLEMLAKHPDTTTHRYYNMVAPYFCYYTPKISKRLKRYYFSLCLTNPSPLGIYQPHQIKRYYPILYNTPQSPLI